MIYYYQCIKSVGVVEKVGLGTKRIETLSRDENISKSFSK